MGGIVSALVENIVGEIKTEEQSKPKPGPIRLALRKARNALVVGKGRALLPQEIDDEYFDKADVEAAKRTASVFVNQRLESKAFTTFVPSAPGSDKGPKKKKVRRVYHKKHSVEGAEMLVSPAKQHASLGRSKSISAGVAVGRQSIIKIDNEMRAARLAKAKKDRQEMEHQRRINEATGCKGKMHESALFILFLLYVIIMLWSIAIYKYILDSDTMTHYDYANAVWYVDVCNVDIRKLKTWWLFNFFITGSMIILVALIELFYWYLAPYSPKAALSAFSRNLARNFVITVWLIFVVIWVIVGSTWFFVAKRKLCGTLQVDHARGLIIAQFAWLAFHFFLFTSDFDNRMALKRLWCFKAEVNTALYHPNSEEEDIGTSDSEMSSIEGQTDESGSEDAPLASTIDILVRKNTETESHTLKIRTNEPLVTQLAEFFADPSPPIIMRVATEDGEDASHVEDLIPGCLYIVEVS
eukprot:TRINITY_DN598_c1_g1_i2.p1 TRINITY_DN598_c1_g1~~TRINITY_DN598_c1_g1_i2.p1  ORF type:complete len:469 (+),score=90.90 TRINITY_DN598_c1_g1_i2:101-1507(+)